MCDDAFGATDASVACNQLGFSRTGTYVHVKLLYLVMNALLAQTTTSRHLCFDESKGRKMYIQAHVVMHICILSNGLHIHNNFQVTYRT